MALVVQLSDPRCRDRAIAGSKAARLAELAAHAVEGAPTHHVPDGFVVTTEAFARFLAGRDPLSHTEEEIASWPLPDEVTRAIPMALPTLGEGIALAVRSSCTAEDLGSASFAGLYETVLDVRGAEAVEIAVRRCFASAFGARVRSYRADAEPPRMAVLVQRLLRADAAGVAFTADPITGRRGVVHVSATRGLGEALVSGTTSAEEWELEGERALRRRSAGVLDEARVRRVAALARALEAAAGEPQDIEWAFEGDALHLLQARPMTALAEEVRWDAPPGAWIRNFRLGEWIGDPLTPLFASWLLPTIEDRVHDELAAIVGIKMQNQRSHIIVNGWYFYGLNMFPKGLAKIPVIAAFLWALIVRFRRVAAVVPPLAHLGFDHELRRWRQELLPVYEDTVRAASERIETADPDALSAIIEELAAAAGDQFASIVGVAGYAAKAELPLAKLWKRELGSIDGSFLDVVRSDARSEPAAHHVMGLDWFFPTLGETGWLELARPDPAALARAKARSESVLGEARAALASRPKMLASFEKLRAEAARAHVARQEQTGALTLAWPALRRAVLRLGEHLVDRRVLDRAEQVFFLEERELREACAEAAPSDRRALTRAREALWQRQRRLAPPLLLGELSGPFKDVFAEIDGILSCAGSDAPDVLRGMPGSPGRASGPVRILRSIDELPRLLAGEILVTRVTTPGWTPAFARAAAVVTDTGSIASHASIVAREYGIPAVVATSCATQRLSDGQIVTVDGGRGLLTIARSGAS